MKIVAILDVDEQKFQESTDDSRDYINEFIGYMHYPTDDNDYVIISKDDMHGTFFKEFSTADCDFLCPFKHK